MSLVKHHHGFLGEFFRHQVSDLWVQQVVVAVHDDVGVQDLKGNKETEKTQRRHHTAMFVLNSTYRVTGQIIRTPAFPPAEVLQVVQVVDAGRKRDLTSDRVKLLQQTQNDKRRWKKRTNRPGAEHSEEKQTNSAGF